MAEKESEANLMKKIRIALSEANCLVFRANVGRAWQGDEVLHVGESIVLNGQPRPFSTGLPTGFSDIFGSTPQGIFFAVEVKTGRRKPTEEQENFIEQVRSRGGRAGVARSVADALKIVQGGTDHE